MKTNTNKLTIILTAVLAALGLSMTACTTCINKKGGAVETGGGTTVRSGSATEKALEKPKDTGNAQFDAINRSVFDARQLFAESKELIVQAIIAKGEAKVTGQEESAAAADKAQGMTLAEKAEVYQKALTDSDAVRLTEEGKILFKKGMDKYADGLKALAPQVVAIANFVPALQSQVKSASYVEKAKLTKMLSPAADLAKTLPGTLSEAITAGGRIVQYGMKNGVSSEKLLSSISGQDQKAAKTTR